MSEVRIRDVMTKKPLSLAVSATVGEALQAAEERDVHHVMMTRNGKFAGVVCMCTLLERERTSDLSGCLPNRTHAVQAESPLWIAKRRFEVDGMSCLPVFEGDDLVGVVTRGDIRRRAPEEAGSLASAPTCSFCGAERHVRPVPERENLFTCLECAHRADPAAVIETGTKD